MIVARGKDNSIACYPAVETIHRFDCASFSGIFTIPHILCVSTDFRSSTVPSFPVY